jgi:hypothetical protein
MITSAFPSHLADAVNLALRLIEKLSTALQRVVIDDLSLTNGVKRVWEITKNNLLLIGISTVGVRAVTGLIGFVLGFAFLTEYTTAVIVLALALYYCYLLRERLSWHWFRSIILPPMLGGAIPIAILMIYNALAFGNPLTIGYERLGNDFQAAMSQGFMGIGLPEDILEAVSLGVDMFDCVMPTRNARDGHLFTSKGDLNIRNAEFADDFDSDYSNGESKYLDSEAKIWGHGLESM